MATSAPPLHPTGGLLGGMRDFSADQIGFLAGTRASGDTVLVNIGPPRLGATVCVLHTAAGAEAVLSAKTASAFRRDAVLYRELRQVIGNGLLTAQDDDWLRQKRFVQPLFTKSRVDGYLQVMLEEIEDVIRSWRSAPEVSLGDSMHHLSLRMVGRVLFGGDLDDVEQTILTVVAQAVSDIIRRASFAGRVPLAWPIPVNRRIRSARDTLYQVVDRIIADRRTSGRRGDDLISRLLDARDGDEQLSDSEVRDQALIFLLAGHETTASATTFALHLLGRHPDVQQRVRDEVADALGECHPSATDLHSRLPVTTAAVKEAMRLYPVVPIAPRRTAVDCEVDGHAIPAGTDTVVCIWSIHHDPAVWQDPHSFRPDRFLGGDPVGRYDWLPFGAGPRACIGQHFAMLEIVATVALLTRAFAMESLVPTDRVPLRSAITLLPREPLRATLRAL